MERKAREEIRRRDGWCERQERRERAEEEEEEEEDGAKGKGDGAKGKRDGAKGKRGDQEKKEDGAKGKRGDQEKKRMERKAREEIRRRDGCPISLLMTKWSAASGFLPSTSMELDLQEPICVSRSVLDDNNLLDRLFQDKMESMDGLRRLVGTEFYLKRVAMYGQNWA
ncbi:hypothetical protein HHK36_024073 [Tetracentron sinense]|uniref:Uncharacterized protein n=1 Tax=Tetracentron sinense TaxID=13715 RepID=A0A834YP28_TETSI|nr:hypothetical protein HHK36_024073 [Tetracentron sinense]